MQVTLEQAPEKDNYPVMMKSKESGIIVLFSDETTGIAVWNPSVPNWKFTGQQKTNWVSCKNVDCWKEYTGTITLKN